jgi:hypothetical protein
MALTIDFANKIIYPDRADMTQIQSTPIEIYQFDINTFHQGMRNLEDDEEGIWADVTHDYASPTTLSGVTYARLVEIINDYTITFLPDSAWVVQVTGGNSNVGDRVNPNNVSVQVANSAGLQDAEALQAGAFGGHVALDITSSFTGTTFPTGTREFPVNNVADAIAIAETRGLRKVTILSDMTLSSGDFSDGYTFNGDSPSTLTLTLDPSTNVTNCTFKTMTVLGTLDGQNTLRDCCVGAINFFNGEIYECALNDTITLGGGTQAGIFDCWSNIPGGGATDYPSVDMGGSGQSLVLRNFSGGIGIKNVTDSTTDKSSIDLNSGRVVFETDVLGGDFVIRGVADVINNAGVNATIDDQTINNDIHDVAKIMRNKTVTDPVAGTITVYDTDDVTILHVAQIFEDAAETQPYRGQGAEVRERLI